MGKRPPMWDLSPADGRPADPCNKVVYGTKGAVELATPDVEFRVPPVTEPGDRPAPGTSTRNRRISIIPSRGKGDFSNAEKARDDLLRNQRCWSYELPD